MSVSKDQKLYQNDTDKETEGIHVLALNILLRYGEKKSEIGFRGSSIHVTAVIPK